MPLPCDPQEVVGFVVLNLIGSCCSNEVVDASDAKSMEEIQKMLASGEAEYGGQLLDGKIVKRDRPHDLGGVASTQPSPARAGLKLPPVGATPEENLEFMKAQMAGLKGEDSPSPKAEAAPLPGGLNEPSEPGPMSEPEPEPEVVDLQKEAEEAEQAKQAEFEVLQAKQAEEAEARLKREAGFKAKEDAEHAAAHAEADDKMAQLKALKAAQAGGGGASAPAPVPAPAPVAASAPVQDDVQAKLAELKRKKAALAAASS